MTRKWLQMFGIALFLLSISAPGLMTLLGDQSGVSVQEKRTLAEPPAYPENAEAWAAWPQAFEDYFQDNFGYRNSLLDLYHQLKYAIKDPSVDKVIYGSEPGWLFYNYHGTDPVGDYRNLNQFSAENLTTFVAHLQQKQQWLAAQGIPYLFVLTPSKHYIYPEYLPKHLSPVGAKNLKQQLAEALQQHPEINFLDLTDHILKNKNQGLLYYKADTHWNIFGANFGQHKIMEKVNTVLAQSFSPRLIPVDQFIRPKTHHGDLARLLKVEQHFEEVVHIPAFEACRHKKMHPGDSTKQADYRFYFTECEDNEVDALIYRDSFFDQLQPYISGYFKHATYLRERFTYETAAIEIARHKPDIVIEQYVDRFLPILYPPEG